MSPRLLHFAVPLAILALTTALFHVFPWDLGFEEAFYDPDSDRWTLATSQPWHALYEYGFYPAWIIVISAIVTLIAGFWAPRLRRYRRHCLYLVLVLAVGPGIIINAVLKEHWGRPRPRDVEELGGKYAFEKVLAYDSSSPGKSFPSGHASMGYYFFALAFLLAALRRRPWAWALGVFAFCYGLLMGIGRMVQGGHFASDVLFSGCIVFLTAAAFYPLLRLDPGDPDS